MKMRYGVLIGVLAATAVVAGEDPPREPRVRAKEPTVVTVRGKQERVEDYQEKTRRSALARVGRGLKTGVMKTAGGVVSLTGWLLNVDDDVPSERERSRKSQDR